MNCSTGSAFSKVPGSTFYEGPGLEPGPLYKVCLIRLYSFRLEKIIGISYKTYFISRQSWRFEYNFLNFSKDVLQISDFILQTFCNWKLGCEFEVFCIN